MMIIDKVVDVRVVPKTKKYWSDRGYKFNIGDFIRVFIQELPNKSNVKVNCVCDTCNVKFLQKICRGTNNCKKCSLSIKMRGNKLGFKTKKHVAPTKNELLSVIDSTSTKTDICKKYNVSTTVLNSWLKTYDINLVSHFGTRFFKSEIDEQKAIESILSLKSNFSISEISRQTQIPRHIIIALNKSKKLQLNTKFDEWETSFKNIVDNFDFYAKENDKKTLKTIADEHDISIEQLKKAFKKFNRPVKLHSYNKSKGELECKEFIINLGEQCHSALIEKKFEVDCYVHSKKFGVEYCGEYWHKYNPKKINKYYHRNKLVFVRKQNIELMTIFESEWKNKNEIVKSMIKSRLGHNNRIYARKCQTKIISKKDAENFHLKNHISSFTNSSINIGLFFNEQLVSVLSFIKSRYDKNYEYEISRFSSILNTTIVGGLSKMFTFFVKTYTPKSCMTYSDMRFGEGKCYQKIGFNEIGTTPPNYYYFDKKKGFLESRMKYQKHMLKKMPNYSEDLTEFEIMDLEGYYKLFDCGNKKYGWISPPIPVTN